MYFSGFTIYRDVCERNTHLCFILVTIDNIFPKIEMKTLPFILYIYIYMYICYSYWQKMTSHRPNNKSFKILNEANKSSYTFLNINIYKSIFVG